MGYDAILFGRLDYQEKEQRTAQKKLQMIWKVNENARKTISRAKYQPIFILSGK